MRVLESAPPTVSRFEADLLTILQGFLGHVPRSQFLPLLARPCARPKCLSRTAVELVQDTLAKGATILVAREGWRQERFLREGGAASGRVWERSPPQRLGLLFSSQSLDFLMWATAVAGDQPTGAWKPRAKQNITLGDCWLLTTAYAAVRHSDIGLLWAQREPWRSVPLCLLWFAADFEAPTNARAPDFEPWLRPAGLAMLEAAQNQLALRWTEMEEEKGRVTSRERLRAMANSQTRVLTAYWKAIDKAGRRDLARFLLAAAGRVLRADVTPHSRLAQLEFGEARLADRQQAYRDVLVVAEHVLRLQEWQSAALGVGYFDEGYAAAQLWKSDWEAYNGDRLAAAARAQLEQTQWL